MREKARILILGSGGMAGHMMTLNFGERENFQVFNAARRQVFEGTLLCDASNAEQLDQLFKEVRPDVVINCVGVLVADSENDPARAILLNSWLPWHLAKRGSEHGWKLIHLSTDCVFSGSRGGYAETDFRDADNPYGRSKALGEVITGPHLTIRTSIIGPELNPAGTGLLQWVLNQSGKISGYSNVFWSGVTTLELSKAIQFAIERDLEGLVHLTGAEKIAKADLLEICNNIWLDGRLKITRNDEPRSDKSLINTRDDFPYDLPGYSQMCQDLKTWMSSHMELYPHLTA